MLSRCFPDAQRRLMLETRPQDAPKRSQERLIACRVESQNAQDDPKTFPRCYQDAKRRFMLETPLGERSDQDGLGELPSESCSKDAVRVREGHRRKAIRDVSPRGFILNALPVLLLTPGF